jgi:hypothetical protein
MRYGSARVTTAPTAEPVTLAELKLHLRLESGVTAEDDLLNDLIVAAREWVERYIERKLITQTVTQTLDDWPGQAYPRGDLPAEGRISDVLAGGARYVELIAGPVQSITSVTIYSDSGASSVWNAANYRLASAQYDRARLALNDGSAWPSATRSTDAIEIVYVAGYGDTGADVPAPIKRAMKLICGFWYEHRGDTSDEPPASIRKTLQPYRFVSL